MVNQTNNEGVFLVVLMIMVAISGFALGFVTGAMLQERGYVRTQHSNVSAKQDKYTSIEELIKANP